MFYTADLPDNQVIQKQILAGLFLCSSQPNDILQQFYPEWNEQVHLSPENKFDLIQKSLNFSLTVSPLRVFPWKPALSEGIDHTAFCHSFFIQPDLFLRIRPGYKNTVLNNLDRHHISCRFINEHCAVLNNTTKLDNIIETDKEAVIQDYSSQQVAKFINPLRSNDTLSVWDCCAGSGGKSILAVDVLKNINLTVTDIRNSILINLKKRFNIAGIKEYNMFEADLTVASLHTNLLFPGKQIKKFDLIICDAPCSGSGTWSRTPEQTYFWKEENLIHYSTLQKKILSNIISFIKPGGYLLYITCSVFKQENEDIVNEIKDRYNLQILKMETLKGYDLKADTLFAALLTSNQ